jgi:hypothetical protein
MVELRTVRELGIEWRWGQSCVLLAERVECSEGAHSRDCHQWGKRFFGSTTLLLWGAACGEERLSFGGVSPFDLAAALDLGVELCAEQDRRVCDPQPD